MTNWVAVIPAGGAGTRLWPLSRKDKPKFLLDMTGTGSSLLQGTIDRLPTDQIMVVTGPNHAALVAEQVPDNIRVITEPSPRESMPAIGLAAALIERQYGPQTVLGSFAADHLIAHTEVFTQRVEQAVALAAEGYLVTIGIAPTRADTGFGYIKQGSAIGHGGYLADSFLEKPDAQTAAHYLADGQYLWNAGMFICQSGRLLDWLADVEPELAQGLRDIAASWGDTDPNPRWNKLKPGVIDRILAEPLAARGAVAVIPADMGWSDIGGYAALREHLDSPQTARDTDPVPVVTEGSDGAVIYTHNRPIVVNGIPHAVVVDTGDVIYVSTTEASNLSTLVPSLTERGLEGLN